MSVPIIASSPGCRLTHKCIKINCYWHQISRGLIPLTGAGMTVEQIKEIYKHNEKFGNSYIPNLRVEFGTNTNYIICDDFKDKSIASVTEYINNISKFEYDDGSYLWYEGHTEISQEEALEKLNMN